MHLKIGKNDAQPLSLHQNHSKTRGWVKICHDFHFVNSSNQMSYCTQTKLIRKVLRIDLRPQTKSFGFVIFNL